MRKLKLFSIFFSFLAIFALVLKTQADFNLGQKLAGRILLQVESNGEAWYVNPIDLKRYYLGRPAQALKIMQKFGLGISNGDLAKISIGILPTNFDNQNDSDNDGLEDNLEKAIGTNPLAFDTDQDGHNDKEEIERNYNPLGPGQLAIDPGFCQQQKGKILLQVESHGEAWYVNPVDLKRYYLGRPAQALKIMQKFGLGINNGDLAKISIGWSQLTNSSYSYDNELSCSNSFQTRTILDGAAAAIRQGDKQKAIEYFVPEMKKAIEYTMDFLDKDGRLTLSNMLSSASLAKESENEIIYTTKVYFALGGYEVLVNFVIKKQPNGSWLLTNL